MRIRCETPLCSPCDARRWSRVERRLTRAIGAARLAVRARPLLCAESDCACQQHQRHVGERWRLLTLTVRHTDAVADVQRLADGWTGLRAWLAAVGVRRPRYARRMEVSAGEDGRPHVHLHVVAALPPICLRSLDAEWSRLTGDPDAAPCDLQTVGAGRRAGQYVAKRGAMRAATYAAKRGRPLAADMAADAACAMWGRRQWAAARALRVPPRDAACRDCGSAAWDICHGSAEDGAAAEAAHDAAVESADMVRAGVAAALARPPP